MNSIAWTPLILSLFGLCVAVMVFRSLGRSLQAARGCAEEGEGAEVFCGDAHEAQQVIHTLADAGVLAWAEEQAGSVRVLVDQDQHAQVPVLLQVQEHLMSSPQQPAQG